MKKVFVLLSGIVLFLLTTAESCDRGSASDRELGKKQEGLMQEANRQVGMPSIVNFQQRKQMKMIIELCDKENIVNYAYLWNEYNGKLVFLGKCVGYGLPYATQFSNPMKTVEGITSGEFATIPQADPNGLFMPSSADGTWVMLIDPKTNEPRPVFVEPNIVVSPFPLEVK